MWRSFSEWKKSHEKTATTDKLDLLVEVLRRSGECKADAMMLCLEERDRSRIDGLLEERDDLIREAMWLYTELHNELGGREAGCRCGTGTTSTAAGTTKG